MSSSLLCGPCEGRQQTIVAAVWCPTCEEGLCKVCLEHHKLSRATREHDVLDKKKYLSFPSFVFKIKQDCSIHDKSLDVYCPNHLEPCCDRCVTTTHAECKGITSLKSVSRNVRSSLYCSDFEKNMEVVLQDLEGLKQNRNKNMNNIPNQKRGVKAKLDHLRSKFNKRFDQLEQNLFHQFDDMAERETTQIKKHIGYIDKIITAVSEIKNNFEIAKAQSSDIQCFLGIHDLEKLLGSEREKIRSLDKNVLINKTLTLSGNSDIHVNSLGSIEVVSSALDIMTSALIPGGAQHTREKSKSANIDGLKAVEHLDITGASIISDILQIGSDKFIISDCSSYNGLILLENGKCQELLISGKPCRLAKMESNLVAVSYPEDKHIKMINVGRISDIKVVRTLKLQKKVTGVSGLSGIIVAGLEAVKGNEMMILDMDGNTLTAIDVGMSEVCFIHATSKGIYCSDSRTNTVICYNTEGSIVCRYSSSSLKCPRGICVDETGNVFVACKKSIAVISATTGNVKVIADDIDAPKAICVNNKTLYVSVGSENVVAVFSIY